MDPSSTEEAAARNITSLNQEIVYDAWFSLIQILVVLLSLLEIVMNIYLISELPRMIILHRNARYLLVSMAACCIGTGIG